MTQSERVVPGESIIYSGFTHRRDPAPHLILDSVVKTTHARHATENPRPDHTSSSHCTITFCPYHLGATPIISLNRPPLATAAHSHTHCTSTLSRPPSHSGLRSDLGDGADSPASLSACLVGGYRCSVSGMGTWPPVSGMGALASPPADSTCGASAVTETT